MEPGFNLDYAFSDFCDPLWDMRCDKCGNVEKRSSKTCNGCDKQFTFNCDCMAMHWCKQNGCICKKCILTYGRVNCQKCNKDMSQKMSQSNYKLVIGDQPIICDECIS